MKVKSYAKQMYQDAATRAMLGRYGDQDVEEVDTRKLMDLASYIRGPIESNPLAKEVCKRHQGSRFTGPVTMELYRACCKGYGVIVY